MGARVLPVPIALDVIKLSNCCPLFSLTEKTLSLSVFYYYNNTSLLLCSLIFANRILLPSWVDFCDWWDSWWDSCFSTFQSESDVTPLPPLTVEQTTIDLINSNNINLLLSPVLFHQCQLASHQCCQQHSPMCVNATDIEWHNGIIIVERISIYWLRGGLWYLKPLLGPKNMTLSEDIHLYLA